MKRHLPKETVRADVYLVLHEGAFGFGKATDNVLHPASVLLEDAHPAAPLTWACSYIAHSRSCVKSDSADLPK